METNSPILDWTICRQPTYWEILFRGIPVLGNCYNNDIKEKINSILQKRKPDILNLWNKYHFEQKKLTEVFFVIKLYQGFCNSYFLPNDSFSLLCDSSYYPMYNTFICTDIINDICRILNPELFKQNDSFLIRSLIACDDLPVVEINKEMTLVDALQYISSLSK